MFYCEYCEISKNTFSYRTPPVAASVLWVVVCYKKHFCLTLTGLSKLSYSKWPFSLLCCDLDTVWMRMQKVCIKKVVRKRFPKMIGEFQMISNLTLKRFAYDFSKKSVIYFRSEYRKIRTRNNSVFRDFSRSVTKL